MTCEERCQYYDAREAYKWKCEDFTEDMRRFFENFTPKNYGQPRNRSNLPQLRA